jgi:hypothetical protein
MSFVWEGQIDGCHIEGYFALGHCKLNFLEAAHSELVRCKMDSPEAGRCGRIGCETGHSHSFAAVGGRVHLIDAYYNQDSLVGTSFSVHCNTAGQISRLLSSKQVESLAFVQVSGNQKLPKMQAMLQWDLP